MAPRRGLLQGTHTEMLQVCQALAQLGSQHLYQATGKSSAEAVHSCLGPGVGLGLQLRAG